MPIRLPETLPAFKTLRDEGVSIMSERTADRQDIRPLRIALLNLMPKKIETERQFARLIGATPLQIDLHLIRMSDHVSRNTDPSHMEQFYRPFSEVKDQRYDGLIITGAPVEHLEFGEVNYWDELREIFDWSQSHIHATMAVCWAGMAAIYHFHDVPKHRLNAKRFGAFRHDNLAPTHPILRGLSDNFIVPVSRWTEVRREDVAANGELQLLLDSEKSGPCLVDDPARRMLYNFNHFEYESHTLKSEYDRDVAEGREINVPDNYYPDDDPSRPPINRWKSSAHLLYTNWIAEIYQGTPYDVNKIGIERHETEL